MLGEKPRVCLDHTQNGMTELRPAHQGRKRKLRISDTGNVPAGSSPVYLQPILPQTGRLAGVGPQQAVPNSAFLSSMTLVTTSTPQGVGFDRVSPQGAGPQGIMPEGILSRGFSSQRFVPAGLSSHNFVSEETTGQEMSQTPTPGVLAARESVVRLSDALQGVSPNSGDLQSTAVSPAMMTGESVLTQSVVMGSEITVPTLSLIHI